MAALQRKIRELQARIEELEEELENEKALRSRVRDHLTVVSQRDSQPAGCVSVLMHEALMSCDTSFIMYLCTRNWHTGR